MDATHFYVKVFVVYGSRAKLSRLAALCVALEHPFGYNVDSVWFTHDPAGLLAEHCPELGLTVDEEKWSTNCFNFKIAVDEQ